MSWINEPTDEYPRWMGSRPVSAPPVFHYPLARPWLLRWLPRRCSCGVARYDRCPDRPGTATDRMPAIWAYVFLLVAAALGAGGWFAWQAFA